MQQINIQNNKQTNQNSQFYTLKKQIIIQDSSLFKLKEYDQNRIVFTASDPRCIGIVDKQFGQIKKYYYDDKPLALDVVDLGGEKFIVVGCNYGNIYVSSFKQVNIPKMKMNIKALKAKQQWILKPLTKQQIFVNDIIHLKNNPNILINCYNNGNIAIWGLLTNKRLHTFQQLHDKYTYKIRLQKQNILVSCGNDCSAIRTDLDKLKPVSVFHHPLPVWCAYPINDNQIATVGIFGRVLIWDARCNRVIQACNNNSNQTSIITTKPSDDIRLIYGDTNLLVSWDRRKNKTDLITSHIMNVSSQSILFSNNNMYVCGRGKDLCLMQPSQTLEQLTESQEVSRTFVEKLAYNSKTFLEIIKNQQSQSSQQPQQQQQQQQQQHQMQEYEQHLSQENVQNQLIQYVIQSNWSEDESDMIEESRSPVISRYKVKQHIKLQSILKVSSEKLLILKESQLQWIEEDDQSQNLSQKKQQKQEQVYEIVGQSESSLMQQEKNA